MQTMAQPYSITDRDLFTSDEPQTYHLRVRDMVQDDKPRERLLAHGPSDLSLQELVAVILGVGTKKEEIMSMARRIFREYGEKALPHERDARKLAETLDIPLASAAKLIASFELGRRFFLAKDGRPVSVRTAENAFEYLRPMGSLKKETLRGLYLNSRYEIIHDEVISIGSVTASIVHPREVFAPALEYGAVAVILAHNHPSGQVEPTDADVNVTVQLRQAANILGLELLDHIVVGQETYYSMMHHQERKDS